MLHYRYFFKKIFLFFIFSFSIFKNSFGSLPGFIIVDFSNLHFDSYAFWMEQKIKKIFYLEELILKNKLMSLLMTYVAASFYFNYLVKNILKEKFFDFFLFHDYEFQSTLRNSNICIDDYIQLLSLSHKIENIYYYNNILMLFCFIPIFCKELKFLIYNRKKIINNIIIMRKKLLSE